MALVAALLLFAPQEFPRLVDDIDDRARVLTSLQEREAYILVRDLERSDSTQVALLTVKSTGGMNIADYALGVFRSNEVGRKEHRNGVLIVISVGDRRVHIQVGLGLEGRLTDLLISRIIRNEMVPKLRAGRIGEGAVAGIVAVVRAARGEYTSPGEGLSFTAREVFSVFLSFPALFVLAYVLKRRDQTWMAAALVPAWAALLAFTMEKTYWVGLIFAALPTAMAQVLGPEDRPWAVGGPASRYPGSAFREGGGASGSW